MLQLGCTLKNIMHKRLYNSFYVKYPEQVNPQRYQKAGGWLPGKRRRGKRSDCLVDAGYFSRGLETFSTQKEVKFDSIVEYTNVTRLDTLKRSIACCMNFTLTEKGIWQSYTWPLPNPAPCLPPGSMDFYSATTESDSILIFKNVIHHQPQS